MYFWQGAFLTGSGSVFSMLDEQLHVPGATDISFLRKINSALKKDKFYVSPKSTSQGKFGVRHYAGEVCDLSPYWSMTCVVMFTCISSW